MDSLKVNTKATRPQAMIAYCHAMLGRFEQARGLIQTIAQSAPDDNDIAYKQAVIEALAGNPQIALPLLERALALGYSRAVAASDRDLDSVRSLPGFAALMAR